MDSMWERHRNISIFKNCTGKATSGGFFQKIFHFHEFFLSCSVASSIFFLNSGLRFRVYNIYLKFDFTIFWGHWFFLSFLLVVYIGGGPLPPSLSVIYTCKIDVWIGLLGGFQNFNFTVTQFDFLQLSDRLLSFLKSDFKFR